KHMITGGDLRQSRLDVGYKTFTISPCFAPRAMKSASILRHSRELGVGTEKMSCNVFWWRAFNVFIVDRVHFNFLPRQSCNE
ncbi:hypothetical protein, partial [Enterobacter hormaechei]|uniref:hypothetical protein n=1 Tax=Enterobacter hormaechei TaxID=158836 RepID=UPI001F420CFD